MMMRMMAQEVVEGGKAAEEVVVGGGQEKATSPNAVNLLFRTLMLYSFVKEVRDRSSATSIGLLTFPQPWVRDCK